MTSVEAPTWDVGAYFAGIASPEFAQAEEGFGAALDRLAALYDRHEVRGGNALAAAPAAVEEILAATNSAYDRLQRLDAYVTAFVATDAADASAQAALSRLNMAAARLVALRSRFDAWLARLDLDLLATGSDAVAAHGHPLRKSAGRARYQMSESEEELAAELAVTGARAWEQLYDDVTAGITRRVDLPSGSAERPIFEIRGLAADADPAVRRAAYEAELAAWAEHAVPIAAALNAIKGEQATLIARRGWASPIDAQLYGQSVDRVTLDSLLGAMVDSFPSFRRYFRAKAEVLGHPDGLPFWDLFAPIGTGGARTWTDAAAAVEAAFATYSPQLRGLAHRAFAESWVDVAPRAGKTGGAFCMAMGDGDSRVLLNFNGSIDGLMTLAHELGHAYHNTTMTERTPLQRATPSSLAETASIFCETIMMQHWLDNLADDRGRLGLLDIDLQGAAQVIVDIHSRFLFESAVFEHRPRGALAPQDFCDLMAHAQAETYGSGLSVGHSWMWAAKPHYYGGLFYNWPYAFGMLFGVGLYARYRSDPDRFRTGYDELLASTGLADAATLAARFDIDIRDRAFWDASLAVVTDRIDQFCTLVADR